MLEYLQRASRRSSSGAGTGLSLLTRSKTFVRSIKAMYNGICCSRHFSCSWRTGENHVHSSTQYLIKALLCPLMTGSARNPHWDSGIGSRGLVGGSEPCKRRLCPQCSAAIYPCSMLQLLRSPFVFVQGDDFGITHILVDFVFSPGCA